MFGEDLFERGNVVERQRERVLGQGGGHAGTVRQPECRDTRTGFDEQAVGVTVIATLKLHELRAARDAAREANGRHRRFGAAADHAYHLDRWDRVDDFLCKLHLELGRRAEARTAGGYLLNRGDDFLVSMSE